MEQLALFEIFTFVAGAMLVVGLGSFTSSLLRSQRPNKEKLSTYESGEEAVGTAWGKFNTRFYVMAIVLVLFEVETVLLFPWATVWTHSELNEATSGLWTSYTALSGMLFITVLALGLAYVWSKVDLTGTPSPLPSSSFVATVPKRYYEQVNHRYATRQQRLDNTTQSP